MKCPMESQENAELLLAYCARRLDQETQSVLERHMAACAPCREFQKGQEAVWNALDAWEALPANSDFDRRLYQRIAAEEARAPWWSRLMWQFHPVLAPSLLSRGVPLAAAICLLLAAGAILDRPGSVVVPEDVTADARMESIQPDQVERTLDEMEMLRQFRVTPATDNGSGNAL